MWDREKNHRIHWWTYLWYLFMYGRHFNSLQSSTGKVNRTEAMELGIHLKHTKKVIFFTNSPVYQQPSNYPFMLLLVRKVESCFETHKSLYTWTFLKGWKHWIFLWISSSLFSSLDKGETGKQMKWLLSSRRRKCCCEDVFLCGHLNKMRGYFRKEYALCKTEKLKWSRWLGWQAFHTY